MLCCKISSPVEDVVLSERMMCWLGLPILRGLIWLPQDAANWCLITWFCLKCSGGRRFGTRFLGQSAIILFGFWLMRRTLPICFFISLSPYSFGISGGEFGQHLASMLPP